MPSRCSDLVVRVLHTGASRLRISEVSDRDPYESNDGPYLKTVHDRPTVMLYMADHGESLGEGGLYLHGVPKAFAPEVQSAVPLMVWMSDAFVQQGGGAKEPASFGGRLSHDMVFHSVMGALGLRSKIYKPENDLFRFTPVQAAAGVPVKAAHEAAHD